MATFWAKNGSAWLWFQFWVPKISLLFIPLGFIHPQEWKIRVQNHKKFIFLYYWCGLCELCELCESDAHWCASANIGAWPTLVETLFGRMPFEHAVSFNTWFFPNCFCKFDYISTAVIICHLWLFFERHFAYFSDWIQRFFFRYLFSQQEKVTGARQLSS